VQAATTATHAVSATTSSSYSGPKNPPRHVDKDERICFKCGTPGHLANKCTNPSKPGGAKLSKDSLKVKYAEERAAEAERLRQAIVRTVMEVQDFQMPTTIDESCDCHYGGTLRSNKKCGHSASCGKFSGKVNLGESHPSSAVPVSKPTTSQSHSPAVEATRPSSSAATSGTTSTDDDDGPIVASVSSVEGQSSSSESVANVPAADPVRPVFGLRDVSIGAKLTVLEFLLMWLWQLFTFAITTSLAMSLTCIVSVLVEHLHLGVALITFIDLSFVCAWFWFVFRKPSRPDRIEWTLVGNAYMSRLGSGDQRHVTWKTCPVGDRNYIADAQYQMWKKITWTKGLWECENKIISGEMLVELNVVGNTARYPNFETFKTAFADTLTSSRKQGHVNIDRVAEVENDIVYNTVDLACTLVQSLRFSSYPIFRVGQQ